MKISWNGIVINSQETKLYLYSSYKNGSPPWFTNIRGKIALNLLICHRWITGNVGNPLKLISFMATQPAPKGSALLFDISTKRWTTFCGHSLSCKMISSPKSKIKSFSATFPSLFHILQTFPYKLLGIVTNLILPGSRFRIRLRDVSELKTLSSSSIPIMNSNSSLLPKVVSWNDLAKSFIR